MVPVAGLPVFPDGLSADRYGLSGPGPGLGYKPVARSGLAAPETGNYPAVHYPGGLVLLRLEQAGYLLPGAALLALPGLPADAPALHPAPDGALHRSGEPGGFRWCCYYFQLLCRAVHYRY